VAVAQKQIPIILIENNPDLIYISLKTYVETLLDPSIPDLAPLTGRDNNRLQVEDRPAHDWYRFVLSFPPHLVRNYLSRFKVGPSALVLDPFCGTGTTLVECKKLGIAAVGIEANPVACFASRVKVNWDVQPDGLLNHARQVASLALDRLTAEGIQDAEALPLFSSPHQHVTPVLRPLPDDIDKLLLKNSISPLPLHKVLVLLDVLDELKNEAFSECERLALAKAVVFGISNLHFGPEVGLGAIKTDASVVGTWLKTVEMMVRDLRELRQKAQVKSLVYQADSRGCLDFLQPESVDAVITSPPYPNEKDYTRTTRLESVILGFVRSKQDLRALKQSLVCSNTRGVYVGDRDDELVAGHEEIQRIAADIERRRIELNKTSGFERLYPRVTKLYFGGMSRHLFALRRVLRPGARLAYVVGDQASYLQVMIRTGQILADIASSLGYELMGIDLFRTRLATATRQALREEIVLLRWPGTEKS